MTLTFDERLSVKMRDALMSGPLTNQSTECNLNAFKHLNGIKESKKKPEKKMSGKLNVAALAHE